MFRTRSDYIKAKDSSYTDIRNQLHRAYQKKGANARVRFVEGHGLYIKNEKADWRKSFDSDDDKKARQAKFDGALEKLAEAIDREYDGWKVGELSMGQHVMRHLAKPSDGDGLEKNPLEQSDSLPTDENGLNEHSLTQNYILPPNNDGLDENALKKIDALIAEGMRSAAANLEQDAQDQSPRRVNASKYARGRLQEARARNDIFEELKSAQDQQASLNWAQRWWARHFGDNHVQLAVDSAFERARNWRALVHGNRLLSDAIEEDIKASGYPGDPKETAGDILKELGLLHTGLTPKGHDEVLNCLKDMGCVSRNVQELRAYADLTQNAKINIERLRRLNSGIDQLNRTVNFGAANNDILIALNASDDALKEAASDLSAGRLSQERHIENLYEELSKSFHRLCEARQSLGSARTPKNAQALDRITALIDEHLAVTHDLASAVLKVNKNNSENHDENFRLPIESDANVILGVDASPLIAGLPGPKTLFQSTARKTNGETMPETAYNTACQRALNAFNSYKRMLSGPRTDQKLKYLGKLRRRVDEASRLNDQCVITSARQSVLGGNAHATVNNHLHAQRGALHVLKLISAQEQLRLKEELAGRGRMRELNPSEANSTSSLENRRRQKFVNPRPGQLGFDSRDGSNDTIYNSSSTATFSNNAGGNESLISFDNSGNSVGPSVDNQHDRDFPPNVAPAMSRHTVAAPMIKKAHSQYVDSLASPSTVGIVVNIPDGSDSAGSNVQTPAGGVSVLSWGRKNSPNPDSVDSPQNAEEQEFSLGNFPGAKDQRLVYHGHAPNTTISHKLNRPLSSLVEDAENQHARSSLFNQPQFIRTVSSETIGDAPVPGGQSELRQLSNATSQFSATSSDKPADLYEQMRTGHTPWLDTVTINSGVSSDDEVAAEKTDIRRDVITNRAGRRFITNIDTDGLHVLDSGGDSDGSGDQEANEAASSSFTVPDLPETNEPDLETGSNSAQYGSTRAQRAARGSGSSRR